VSFTISRATSDDDGATWSAPVAVDYSTDTDNHFKFSPEISTDGNGNWIIGWVRGNPNFSVGVPQRAVVSRSSDNGATWTDGQELDPGASLFGPDISATQVTLTTDGHGNWIAGLVYKPIPASLAAHSMFLSRSSDYGATWTPSMRLLPDAAHNELGDRGFPAVATDRAGNWIVLWEAQHKQGSQFGMFDILQSRWTSILAPDRDGDYLSDADETTAGTSSDTWDTDGDLLSDADEVALGTNPLLADTDGDGVLDGIEIALGTDPLDPFDFPILPLFWMVQAAGIAAISMATFVMRCRRAETKLGENRGN